jgi:hypothetical protein
LPFGVAGVIDLHYGQSDAYEDLFIDQAHRFVSVCCARGWGKSYFLSACAATAVHELMALPRNVPNKRVGIIAPTYDQVTDIFYPILAQDMGLEEIAIKASQDEGRFVLPNNVELRLLSFEAVQRMRGKGYYFVGWDEVTTCTKGIGAKAAWESIVRPCISTRWSPANARRYGARSPGRAVFASTPNGYDFFHELHHFHEKDPTWNSYHYDYTGSPFLDPEEIVALKSTMDPRAFAAEYMASFMDSGNMVFYSYERAKHNKTLEPLGEHEDVHVAIDFNVGELYAHILNLVNSENILMGQL